VIRKTERLHGRRSPRPAAPPPGRSINRDRPRANGWFAGVQQHVHDDWRARHRWVDPRAAPRSPHRSLRPSTRPAGRHASRPRPSHSTGSTSRCSETIGRVPQGRPDAAASPQERMLPSAFQIGGRGGGRRRPFGLPVVPEGVVQRESRPIRSRPGSARRSCGRGPRREASRKSISPRRSPPIIAPPGDRAGFGDVGR